MSKNNMYKITSFFYDGNKVAAIQTERDSCLSYAKDTVEWKIKSYSNDKIELTYSDDKTLIYTDSKGLIRYLIQEFSVSIIDDTVDFSTSYTDHLVWDIHAKNADIGVVIEHIDRTELYI